MTTDFDAPTKAIDDIAGDYTIDASHSRLGFVARHAMVTKVRGQFGAFEGTAHIDTVAPANSKVELSINGASIDTRRSGGPTWKRSSTWTPSRPGSSCPPTSSATVRSGTSPAT